jgi:hypothetical protein
VTRRGKRHPITNEPLSLERFALPPGSICCVLSHGAHGVAPKHEAAGTRYCTLHAYRKAHGDSVQSPGRQVPPVWAAKAAAGALPPVLSELFKGVGDIFESRGLLAKQHQQQRQRQRQQPPKPRM